MTDDSGAWDSPPDRPSAASALRLGVAAIFAGVAGFCVAVFRRQGQVGMMGGGLRIAFVLVGGGFLLLAADAWHGMRDDTAARRAFDLHADELAARAFAPGS